MKPFSVNLSKFKKIAHDKKSTVLRDPDGHEIRIVHSAIPAIQRKQLEGLPMYAEGGDVAKADEQKPVTVNVNQAPTEGAAPKPAPAAQFAQQPVDVVATQPKPPKSMMAQDQTLDAPSAVQLEQKAVREQQAIDAAKGAAAANVEQGYNNQKAQIIQQEQDNVNSVKQHADEFATHIRQNQIDPNHWAESRSTSQKVVNALGLLLGGFKQGAIGGNNPAMDFINAQIDRDVAAQRARADNQKNVYGAYRELYGDQMAATNAAKASMLDVYNHKMQQIAAQLGTPQAQANADAFAAKTAIERNQLLLDTAGRLGTLNVGQPMTQAPVQQGAPAQNTAQATPAEAETPWYRKAPAEALHDKAMGVLGDAINLNTAPEQASAVEKQNSKEDYYDSHILEPNAIDHFKRLAYTPKAKDDLAAIQHQYNSAVQADKALADINNTFSKLISETNGMSGRVHRGVSPTAMAAVGAGVGAAAGGIPTGGVGAAPGAGLGGALGGGLGHAIKSLTNTSENRAFESDKTALLGYVSAALKGTNIGAGQIQEVVDANTPESGDDPKHAAKKLKNIKEFILNHTDTSLLKTWGLSKR